MIYALRKDGLWNSEARLSQKNCFLEMVFCRLGKARDRRMYVYRGESRLRHYAYSWGIEFFIKDGCFMYLGFDFLDQNSHTCSNELRCYGARFLLSTLHSCKERKYYAYCGCCGLFIKRKEGCFCNYSGNLHI